MQITLTLDLTEDNLDKLKVLCTETKAVVKTTKKSSKKQTKEELVAENSEPAEATIKPTPESEEKLAPAATEEKTAITKTDVRAVALKISKAGKSDTLREIFSKFGATNLKGIAEKDYEALMRELVAVNV